MKELRIKPGSEVRLDRIDAKDTSAFDGGKEEAEARMVKLRQDLDRLQELLYADHRHALLVVLQGMDTAGKDGTIRHVFEGVNPQGVRVAAFRIPTPVESAHDFLWRVHAQTPGKGEITIFNRSHYEDVLVARVHNLVPKEVWERRFDAINGFERELSREGTTVLKFFLHIDKEEQKARLQARQEDASKRWKLSGSDVQERRFWSDYQTAYSDVLAKTSTEWAPWHVVPSDHKWFRNWYISRVLIDTLDGLKLSYPKGADDLSSLKIS